VNNSSEYCIIDYHDKAEIGTVESYTSLIAKQVLLM